MSTQSAVSIFALGGSLACGAAALVLWSHWSHKRLLESLTSIALKIDDLAAQCARSRVRGPDDREVAVAPTDDFLYIRRYDDDIDALDGLGASDWMYDRTIPRLFSDDAPILAMERLHDEKCSCALVYDRDATNTLIGVLDLLDIVRYVLRGMGDESLSLQRLLRTCIIAPLTFSLNDVCRHLRAGSRHIALDAVDGAHQIVSQRSIAKALYEIASTDPNLRGALETRPVMDGSSADGLKSCLNSQTAREAFQIMAMYELTSIPICDSVTRSIIGVISATDILICRADHARLLDLDVLSYVDRSRDDLNIARASSCVVSCRREDSLLCALEIMLSNQVHHVYILDEAKQPIGVVSFVDILRRV